MGYIGLIKSKLNFPTTVNPKPNLTEIHSVLSGVQYTDIYINDLGTTFITFSFCTFRLEKAYRFTSLVNVMFCRHTWDRLLLTATAFIY